MSPGLEQRLQELDGTAISPLSEARAAFRSDPGFPADLVRLAGHGDPAVSMGATWILKAEVEDGTRFGADLIRPLGAALEGITAWQARLHILQSVDGFDLDPPLADSMFAWASAQATHARPFLRAWALHAQISIGRRFPAHFAAAQQALLAAKEDPAASVRARARNLEKELG